VKAKKQIKQPEYWVLKTARYIFFGLLAYMPLHIFLSTWIGTSFDILSFAKVAKEFVLLFGFGLALGMSIRKPWFKQLIRDKLVWLIVAFGLLHVLLILLRDTDQEAALLALAYNTRYLVFFLYAVLLAKMYGRGHLVKRSVQIVLASATIVLLFGAVQYNVLPHNTLESFGYSRESGVLPAFFIDDKVDFPRVMSTVRDPNSYGSYLLIIIALAATYLRVVRRVGSRYLLVGVLGLSVINLLATYSRSAWVGLAFVSVLLLSFWIKDSSRRQKLTREAKLVISSALVGLIVISAGGLYAIRDSYAFQNIVFHADDSTVLETPNQKRLRFWRESAAATVENPVGHGPGTAGLPSIRNQEQGTVLNENYYLQIAYEVGVAGFLLFISILAIIAIRLWRSARRNTIAVALLASFVGLAITNFLVHIWANEAVAYTWWGLAGLVVVVGTKANHKKTAKKTTT